MGRGEPSPRPFLICDLVVFKVRATTSNPTLAGIFMVTRLDRSAPKVMIWDGVSEFWAAESILEEPPHKNLRYLLW